ncbi:hypothetical protein TNCV_3330841 [Trichonephila clavipes]|nr:hypothetical protein TNCV_3330841 [Trichonephila clavipes]
MRVAASRFVERNSRKDPKTRPLRRPILLHVACFSDLNYYVQELRSAKMDEDSPHLVQLPDDMSFSESDSEDGMEERRSPSPLPPPPTISGFKSNLVNCQYSILYMNIGLDIQNSIRRVDLYHFDDEDEKKKIETSNQYDALPTYHGEENEDETEVPVHHNTVRPPPPITIDNVKLPNQLLKKLQDTTQQKMKGRMVGKGLRIYRKPRKLTTPLGNMLIPKNSKHSHISFLKIEKSRLSFGACRPIPPRRNNRRSPDGGNQG